LTKKNSDLECLLNSNLAVSLRQTPPEPQTQPHASLPPVCCFVSSISHLIFFSLSSKPKPKPFTTINSGFLLPQHLHNLLPQKPISQNLQILHLLIPTPPKSSKNFTFIEITLLLHYHTSLNSKTNMGSLTIFKPMLPSLEYSVIGT